MKSDGQGQISRRSILVGAASGVAFALLPMSSALAAPNYGVIPKLPGETQRTETKYTSNGTPYEMIDVNISGDLARLFVPHTAKPSLTKGVAVVWYYHANGSRYTALSSAFIWPAERGVEMGAIAICPDYAGASAWTNSDAIKAQKNAVAWIKSQWYVGLSFLRANSGGGSLMTLAYGNRWIPGQRGMYLASATYDMEDLYDRDPGRIGPAYAADIPTAGPTPWALSKFNAARLPATAWAGSRIRVAAATNDTVVPADKHGLALLGKAAPVAIEATSRTFTTPLGVGIGGHYVPDWVNGDMVTTFQSWL